VAFSPSEHDMAVKDMIAQADQAMYVAKALGGNHVEMAENVSVNGCGDAG